jgi:ATP phosphoribosyltransferase regulatory subunit
MTLDTRWLLPDGIDELLPERAEAVETLRRRLLDSCDLWGYRYVIPPLVEYTDSLLVGFGADLDVLTCKFTDRMSGRTLGVRADMTPQVARIDAHSLGEPGITRLCYAGSTLHSAPLSVMAGRSPIQLGAELFGSTDISADIEVITLLLSLLQEAGFGTAAQPITLDLGHIGIYEALIAHTEFSSAQQSALFDALQRKSSPDLANVLADVPSDTAQLFHTLLTLNGGVDVLARARNSFGDKLGISDALEALEQVLAAVQEGHPNVRLYIDLAELRGFRYHTGLVFAAYLDGMGAAVAKGGRYDNVGDAFGRSRPATGFACDLKVLAGAMRNPSPEPETIAAPADGPQGLQDHIRSLRQQGVRVITALGEQTDSRCSARLVFTEDKWHIVPIVELES